MTRLTLIGLILLSEFAILEAGLRVFGQAEAGAAFQSLFIPDNRIGYRLRPGAAIRYTTREFSTDLVINKRGVRDDKEIGPKGSRERRVLILGDSYVFAVQVPFRETFGERLEAQLNASDAGLTWRVINAGVQGYGPVEEWLWYENTGAALEADIVLIVVSVANDAIEAFDAREKLANGSSPDANTRVRTRLTLRQVVRSSAVLQLVRQRGDQLRARMSASIAERPLATYLEEPPTFVIDGVKTATDAFGRIATSARHDGARVAFVLMPARFQTHDADFARVARTAEGAGAALRRHAATERFADTLRPLGAPILDLLPVFASAEDREGLHFVRNTHLSARGHRVTADAILRFLRGSRLVVSGPD
ncbi:MAG TPA: hypothetical protein VM115_03580 [Vicinamibacterales bacterium]|nr:hypothetical protein [Vicinamibacterales bacterium]